jgi:predicted small lipoprotein YifL
VTRAAAVIALALAAGTACGRKGRVLPPELVEPMPPADLTAASTTDGVRLSWLRPDRYSGGARMKDLDHFLIERAPADVSPPRFAPVATIMVTDQLRFRPERRFDWVDRSAAPGGRYLYRVTAVTADRYRSRAAGPVAVRFEPTQAAAPPAPPKEPAP